MTPHPTPEFYLSLFLFCDDLQPQDQAARQQTVWRVQQLQAMGYRGVEMPIAPTGLQDPRQELEHYRLLRQELDAAGCAEVAITTNVAVTARFDPTAESAEQRRQALAYLRSRLDITAALRGTVMMGPLVFPYAQRPRGEDGALLWSDDLQASWPRACDRARPVLEALAQQASELQVKLAIEPISHWEMPAFNTLEQVMAFVETIANPQLGVVIDSAHEVLDGAGPERFAQQVARLATAGRLHYLQLSAPDRGRLDQCWLPWQPFLQAVLPHYQGPWAIEIFNALPVFQPLLRLSRRLYPFKTHNGAAQETQAGSPTALEVARLALEVAQREILDALMHANSSLMLHDSS